MSERLERLGHLDGWGGGTAGVEERRGWLQEQPGLLHTYDNACAHTFRNSVDSGCLARGKKKDAGEMMPWGGWQGP